MSIESAAEYYEFHETREELTAPADHWDPWVKCTVCEEFLVVAEALRLDGLWFHPGCLSDADRVKAMEQEEAEGLDEDEVAEDLSAIYPHDEEDGITSDHLEIGLFESREATKEVV